MKAADKKTHDPSKPISDGRRERYATLLAAGGMSAAIAHGQSGFKPDPGNAVHMRKEPDIAGRVAWLQEQAAKRVVADKAWVLLKLRNLVIRTMTPGDEFTPSAANKALELLGKEQGMFVDRRVLGVRRIDDMSEEELLEFLGGEPSPDELREASGFKTIGNA